jgi:hypothetical protein
MKTLAKDVNSVIQRGVQYDSKKEARGGQEGIRKDYQSDT